MKKLVLETEKVAHNLSVIRKNAKSAKVIAVVKGNGYGFGLAKFATLCVELGADLIAVSTVEEAESLRLAGFEQDILLLSPTEKKEVAEKIVALNLIASVASLEGLVILNLVSKEADRMTPVHLAFDTGMGRFGFMKEDVPSLCQTLSTFENLKIEGIFSHLSSSFVSKSKLTAEQQELFGQILDLFAENQVSFEWVHLANSCAVFQYPKCIFSAVRVGSALIGRLPSGIGKGLKKCGFLECSLDNARFLPPKHNIGYANTYTTKKATRIAVAEVGYSDGIALRKAQDCFRFSDRLRNLKDAVLFLLKGGAVSCTVNGKRTKVLGRVGMTNCVVDITRIKDYDEKAVAVFDVNPTHINPLIEREYR